MTNAAIRSAMPLVNKAFKQARPRLLSLAPANAKLIDKSIADAKRIIMSNIEKAVKDAANHEVGTVNDFIHRATAERMYVLVDSIVEYKLHPKPKPEPTRRELRRERRANRQGTTAAVVEDNNPNFSNISNELIGLLDGVSANVVQLISFDNIGSTLNNAAKAAWNDEDKCKIFSDIAP